MATDTQEPEFREELQHVLNKHSIDAKTNMPDFILAALLENIIIDLIHANAATKRWKEGT